MYWISIALAVIGSVLYNVFQKLIAPGANPLVSLLITYATAIALTASALLVFPAKAGFVGALRQAN